MTDRMFRIIYFLGLIVGSIIRAWYTRQKRQNKLETSRRTGLDIFLMSLPSLGLLIIPLVYVSSSWLRWANYRLPRWAGFLGTCLYGTSQWLLWRSHADLGQNWSETLELRAGHTLIKTGVYQHIRHPMYAAHWLWALAQPLLLHNWIAGWSLLITLLPLYIIRVPREEQMMLEQFGAEYREYMQETGRILPTFRRRKGL